jgi:hypothetical protein
VTTPPPAPGVAESLTTLIPWLIEMAVQAADKDAPDAAGKLTLAAQLLGERLDDDAVPVEILKIGERLRIQDNRCTADPIFQVQVKERIYGLDSSSSDDFVWRDDDWNDVEIPEGADPDSPPKGVEVVYYATRWRVVSVALTEEGCKEHLRLNGHNYRGYDEVRIYADSLYRCPEMIAIREFLMALPLPEAP